MRNTAAHIANEFQKPVIAEKTVDAILDAILMQKHRDGSSASNSRSCFEGINIQEGNKEMGDGASSRTSCME